MLLPLLQNNMQGTAPTLVTVPDVVGQTQAAGTATLEGLLFVVAVETAYSSSVPAGTIISQSPVGGTDAIQGSTVTIVVSLGEAATQGSGGIWYEFERVRARTRKRKQDEEERKERARKLASVDREIAEIIYADEAKKEAAADLKRVQELADKYAGSAMREGIPRNVASAVLKAQEERTRNALEQMQREIQRMLDDEEQEQIALLLMDD